MLVPTIEVFQLLFLYVTCCRVEASGSTPARPWTPARIAFASSTVSVDTDPKPWRTPPTFALPGVTVRKLLPSPCICFCTPAVAPWPTETIAITAPTPMSIPSIVRTARILFCKSDRAADRTFSHSSAGVRNAWRCRVLRVTAALSFCTSIPPPFMPLGFRTASSLTMTPSLNFTTRLA